MYVKKNLWLWVAVFTLALPLMLTGTASAKYIGDGAVQNGTTGGWDLPADRGVCVTGVKSDGTMVVDSTITSRADCLAKVHKTLTTSTACKTGDAGGSHYWTSTCVDASGNGISLSGLDRNANMCTQKGGTWKSACTSSWTAMGPTWSAAADPKPAEGGTDGFCYTAVRLDNYDVTSCPTATHPTNPTFGYSLSGSNCVYSYGIQGKLNKALTAMDGTTIVAAGTNVDLTGLSMGDCSYKGASFSNHTTKGGTAAVATADPAGSTIATPITGVRAGCLSCHNETSQYNSYKGRWKDSYLKTGHKNMLRKATAGKAWAGPNDSGVLEAYTAWGTGGANTINWTDATTTVSGTSYPLMYIFGDWMAPAPAGLDVVNWAGTAAKYNNGNGYSCTPCHTTGWRNEDTTKGVCTISSNTNLAACIAAGGDWVPSSGAQGYGVGGAEPAASFPGYASSGTIPGITGQWDVDGIVCSRCHAVTYDPNLPLNENKANAAPGHTTHETEIFEGNIITNICYGCHQSPAKTASGNGADIDLANPQNIPVKDSDSTPAYVPEFSGHVLGNSFLNSPHAKFTGTITPNALGKYDIAGGTYVSTFKGKVCRSSTTAGSGSVLETTAVGGVIESLEDCNKANGKPAGDTTSYGYWQDENGGSCATCHDVHNSLFVAGQEHHAMRRECQTCHADTAGNGYAAAGVPQLNSVNHPTTAGTPGDTEIYANSCEVCHMPKATSGGFPMHLWRISTDPAYSTFPTQAEFESGDLKIGRSKLGTTNGKVYVDLDLACGQCHKAGGPAGATVFTKTQLVFFAKTIHTGGQMANRTLNHPTTGLSTTPKVCTDCHTDGAVAGGTFNINPGCTQCHGGGNGPAPEDYNLAGPFKTTAILEAIAKTMHIGSNNKPVVGSSNSISGANGMTVTVVDSSSDADGTPDVVTIFWGDGSKSTGARGESFTHTYTRAKTYTVSHSVYDGIETDSEIFTVTVPMTIAISGNVKVDGANAGDVTLILKYNGHTKQRTKSKADGTYSFTKVRPITSGKYTINAYKYHVDFKAPNGNAPLDLGPVSSNKSDANITGKKF